LRQDQNLINLILMGSRRVVKRNYPNGDVYEGEIDPTGRRDGSGTFLWSDGGWYKGSFVEGLRKGFGVSEEGKQHDGKECFVRYSGFWEKGKRHGKGVLKVGGDWFEGEFRDGNFANGVVVYENGDRYEGEFRKDFFHGKGRLERLNGDVLEGNFANGKLHGFGKAIFGKEMGSYEGEWRFGRFHGNGLRVFSGGSRYEGKFRLGRMHGNGILSKENGDVFIGEMSDGERHGRGSLAKSNGDRLEGTFVRGNLQGRGKIIYRDGGWFEGEIPAGHGVRMFSNEKKLVGFFDSERRLQGEGVEEHPDGSRYEGNFKDGQKHGQGSMSYFRTESPLKLFTGFGKMLPKGGKSTYEGEWLHDEWNGKGKFFCADGTSFDGEFKNSKPHGFGVKVMIPESELDSMGLFYRAQKYVGEFVDGQFEGNGSLFFQRGKKILKGTFVASKWVESSSS